jgi:hypothetical protein
MLTIGGVKDVKGTMPYGRGLALVPSEAVWQLLRMRQLAQRRIADAERLYEAGTNLTSLSAKEGRRHGHKHGGIHAARA